MCAVQPYGHIAGPDFCNFYFRSVQGGKIDPELVFFTDETQFYMNGHGTTQNNRRCSTEDPHFLHEIPLHSVTVGVWCALSAKRVTGSVFLWALFQYVCKADTAAVFHILDR